MIAKTLSAAALAATLLVLPVVSYGQSGTSTADKTAEWTSLPVFDQAGKKIGTISEARADGTGHVTDIVVDTDAGQQILVANEQFDRGTAGVTLSMTEGQLLKGAVPVK